MRATSDKAIVFHQHNSGCVVEIDVVPQQPVKKAKKDLIAEKRQKLKVKEYCGDRASPLEPTKGASLPKLPCVEMEIIGLSDDKEILLPTSKKNQLISEGILKAITN